MHGNSGDVSRVSTSGSNISGAENIDHPLAAGQLDHNTLDRYDSIYLSAATAVNECSSMQPSYLAVLWVMAAAVSAVYPALQSTCTLQYICTCAAVVVVVVVVAPWSRDSPHRPLWCGRIEEVCSLEKVAAVSRPAASAGLYTSR